jgi:hypothetical protein
MPMWRCPHCGTPQAETARCWVCRRSSTSCATCRHYRRSIAASLGYCGLDRRRQPLTGDEIRACWDGWPAGAAMSPSALPIIGPARTDEPAHRPLEFVAVEALEAGTDDPAADVDEAPVVATTPSAGEPGWSLWGDLDG